MQRVKTGNGAYQEIPLMVDATEQMKELKQEVKLIERTNEQLRYEKLEQKEKMMMEILELKFQISKLQRENHMLKRDALGKPYF